MAMASESIEDYFEATFTARPNPWLREVLLMTTEMLSPEQFLQVAMYYLDADDGSGATLHCAQSSAPTRNPRGALVSVSAG